jgi:hypothetical protein
MLCMTAKLTADVADGQTRSFAAMSTARPLFHRKGTSIRHLAMSHKCHNCGLIHCNEVDAYYY